MGTANFHTVNAEGIYVKYDRWQDEECGELVFREWEELNEEIIRIGELQDWYKNEKLFGIGWNRDSSVISKDFWFEYFKSGFRYRVEAFITLNQGYYEHCNLDYRLVVDGMEYDENLYDIKDMIVEDFTSDCNCCSLCYSPNNGEAWNLGLRKMHKVGFERHLEKFLSEIVEECESMCKRLCDEEYRYVCKASNGEVLYEKK